VGTELQQEDNGDRETATSVPAKIWEGRCNI